MAFAYKLLFHFDESVTLIASVAILAGVVTQAVFVLGAVLVLFSLDERRLLAKAVNVKGVTHSFCASLNDIFKVVISLVKQ